MSLILSTIAALTSFSGSASEAEASWPFFALCMDTHDAKKRDLDEQAKLLAELGYAGAGHLWLDGLGEGTGTVDGVARRLKTLEASGLRLFQVYARIDLAAPAPYAPKMKDLFPLLARKGTQVALLMTGGKPSDESKDARAVEVLRELADLARPHKVPIVLYPHVGDWLEKVEDAVRIARKVDRPEVGVMFNFCHWLKVGDEAKLRDLLRLAKPYLRAVSLNGSDRGADVRSGKGGWILPLGQGSYDMAAFLKALREEADFRGPVGLQCYGIPGDARDHLARSIEAWRKLWKGSGR
jgi:sugar phosphate isomerase/epimerase